MIDAIFLIILKQDNFFLFFGGSVSFSTLRSQKKLSNTFKTYNLVRFICDTQVFFFYIILLYPNYIKIIFRQTTWQTLENYYGVAIIKLSSTQFNYNVIIVLKKKKKTVHFFFFLQYPHHVQFITTY